jgi:type VI secretion system protein ImpJ
MSSFSRVAWREGMFLRPQHFQQQDRFFEMQLRGRAAALQPYGWGLLSIKFSEGLLALGKIGIEKCIGVFPDGTQFSIPGDFAPPEPLSISDDIRDAIVYLSLPLQQVGSIEFADRETISDVARHVVEEVEINDAFSSERTAEYIDIGILNVKLAVRKEETAGRVLVGLCRVRDVTQKQITLDDKYIPPCLDFRASGQLRDWLSDIIGRTDQRVDELALRAVEATDGGSETFGSYLMLQALNRWSPILCHLDALPNVHPERLYETLASMAGELCTMSRPKDRRPPKFPIYDHENLRLTFDPVIEILQAALSVAIAKNAGQLQLNDMRHGAYSARIDDMTLLRGSNLYLAVSARVPAESIRKRFPSVVKIGPTNRMREIVGSALEAGVRISYTPAPPPQIRILQGYNYFELDRSSNDWKDLLSATAIGMHVADDWPDLKIELWWVKRS